MKCHRIPIADDLERSTFLSSVALSRPRKIHHNLEKTIITLKLVFNIHLSYGAIRVVSPLIDEFGETGHNADTLETLYLEMVDGVKQNQPLLSR